jgi:hypothetical protein
MEIGMKKLGILVLAAATALVLTVGSGSAVAASPKQECERAGGTWSDTPPDQQCTFPGTPPGKNKGGVVKDEETITDRGKSGPHETTEECQVINNGGRHNCTTS